MPTLSVDAGVARITLHVPPMNLLDRATVRRLGELLAQCEADAAVRAIVLYGGERAFSAGSDLREVAALVARGPEALAGKFAGDGAVFTQLARCAKPTLAAIEGAALGGGLELAACCDLIVCARGARLGLPEIRLGAFPGSGGTLRVTRRIGPGRARRMMLLGDPITAETALAWGLVDEVVEPGQALACAQQLAARMAAGPARALEGCKRAIDAALALDEAGALAVADTWALSVGFSSDLQEGLAAFAEKRAPVFGRAND